MKKIILMAAFAVASVAASAQVYVGGGLGFSSEKAAHVEGVDVDALNTIKILPHLLLPFLKKLCHLSIKENRPEKATGRGKLL